MTRFIFKRNTIITLLIFALFFQSCTVYKKTPVTMDQAVTAKTKVLILRSDNRKIHLKRVVKIDSTYYGQKRIKGQKTNIPLANLDIKTIKVKNKTASTFGTTGIVVGSLLSIITVIGVAAFNNTEMSINFPASSYPR